MGLFWIYTKLTPNVRLKSLLPTTIKPMPSQHFSEQTSPATFNIQSNKNFANLPFGFLIVIQGYVMSFDLATFSKNLQQDISKFCQLRRISYWDVVHDYNVLCLKNWHIYDQIFQTYFIASLRVASSLNFLTPPWGWVPPEFLKLPLFTHEAFSPSISENIECGNENMYVLIGIEMVSFNESICYF